MKKKIKEISKLQNFLKYIHILNLKNPHCLGYFPFINFTLFSRINSKLLLTFSMLTQTNREWQPLSFKKPLCLLNFLCMHFTLLEYYVLILSILYFTYMYK